MNLIHVLWNDRVRCTWQEKTKWPEGFSSSAKVILYETSVSIYWWAKMIFVLECGATPGGESAPEYLIHQVPAVHLKPLKWFHEWGEEMFYSQSLDRERGRKSIRSRKIQLFRSRFGDKKEDITTDQNIHQFALVGELFVPQSRCLGEKYWDGEMKEDV